MTAEDIKQLLDDAHKQEIKIAEAQGRLSTAEREVKLAKADLMEIYAYSKGIKITLQHALKKVEGK